MLKAVLFDLDGTLIDSTDAIVDSVWHTMDTLGAPRPTREAIIDSIGFPLHQQLALLTEIDVETCVPIYRAHYDATARDRTFLLPGARDLLAACREAGLRMALVTSKKRAAAEMLLEYLGVLHYFEVCIGPEEVSRPKPDPEPVIAALNALGIAADEAILIGDMHFDVIAARAAKVRCLAVTTGYATRADLETINPGAVFGSLAEVQIYLMV